MIHSENNDHPETGRQTVANNIANSPIILAIFIDNTS